MNLKRLNPVLGIVWLESVRCEINCRQLIIKPMETGGFRWGGKL